MDILKVKKLKSNTHKLLNKLNESKVTNEFLNPPRPEILALCVGLSLQNDAETLYNHLKSIYIKEQSNEELEYYTILAAYSSKNYKECLFLAQDLIVSMKSPELFIIILKLCINNLNLAETALYYSELSLKSNPENNLLLTARAVTLIYNSGLTIYASSRSKLLEEARDLLNSSTSTGPCILFYKALVNAHLKNLNLGLNLATEGLRMTMKANYFALVALIMLAQEDFTGALAILKRGLQANPCNLLLYGIKLYSKYLMFEHTHDKDSVKKSIKTLVKMCKEGAEDSNSSVPEIIKEESENVDSNYIDDVFKDSGANHGENFEQVAKMSFRIAYDIEDFDLLDLIFHKIKENRIESAILNFIKTQKTEELENYCEDLWVCEILAHAFYQSGAKTAAISYCKQAIRLNENSKKAWALLGKIYKEQDFFEDAMDAFLMALKSVPVNFSLIPIYLEDF